MIGLVEYTLGYNATERSGGCQKRGLKTIVTNTLRPHVPEVNGQMIEIADNGDIIFRGSLIGLWQQRGE